MQTFPIWNLDILLHFSFTKPGLERQSWIKAWQIDLNPIANSNHKLEIVGEGYKSKGRDKESETKEKWR